MQSPQIPTTSPAAPGWRIPEIDGLRAMAILMVFCCHAWLFAGKPVLLIHFLGIPMNLMSAFALGSTGVDLFMVLSGFCLFFPLCKSPAALESWSAANFYRKRVRRIVPPYYAAILYATLLPVVLVVLLRLIGTPSKWQPLYPPIAYLANLLFLQTLIPEAYGTINAAFWSMALEVQFYLVFPLVVASFRRFQLWAIIGLILISIGYRIGIRFYTASMEPLHQILYTIFFLGRWMQFAMGMGAAWIVAKYRSENRWRHNHVGSLILLGALAIYTLSNTFGFDWLQNLGLSIAFALSMVGLCITRTPVRFLFDNRLMRWLGYISYSIFLTHWPTLYYVSELVGKFLDPHSGITFLALCGVGFPIVLMVSYGFFLLFEKPFLNPPSVAKQASAIA